MKIGKVPNDILQKIVLNKIKSHRRDVIIKPKVGEDCCAVDFEKFVCVMSSDPITGAVNEVGRLAVHVSCNDIASCGAEPLGLIVTILAPPGTGEEDLDIVMKQLCDTADSINVEIIGGHTEITTAVNRFVIVTTAVGKAIKDKLVTTSGAGPGDDVILTKTAGIEGTAVIAHDKEHELTNVFGMKFVENAKNFIQYISVVKEGAIAGEFGVTSMHDVTEGGVLGAAWEVAQASGTGIRLYRDRIPVAEETSKIAEYYNIDPLKLISSGCMLITCKDGVKLVERLEKNGIMASIIGEIIGENERILICNDTAKQISQPEPDELYKIISI